MPEWIEQTRCVVRCKKRAPPLLPDHNAFAYQLGNRSPVRPHTHVELHRQFLFAWKRHSGFDSLLLQEPDELFFNHSVKWNRSILIKNERRTIRGTILFARW